MDELRIVTATFLAEQPWPQVRLHVDGQPYGKAGPDPAGWMLRRTGKPDQAFESYWDVVNSLAQLPPLARRDYGLAISLPPGEIRRAHQCWGVRMAAPAAPRETDAAYAFYLAGWMDSLERDRQVERAEVERGMRR